MCNLAWRTPSGSPEGRRLPDPPERGTSPDPTLRVASPERAATVVGDDTVGDAILVRGTSAIFLCWRRQGRRQLELVQRNSADFLERDIAARRDRP